MGFLGDINKLKKQAKEMEKTWDPGAQARESLEQMKAMNARLEQATHAMAEGDLARAQVVSVGPTTGMMNMDPLLPIELLVQQDGAPPRPVSITTAVPQAQLFRVRPGSMLTVRVSRTDPNAVAIDWMAPII